MSEKIKMTKKLAERLCYKADVEGLSYAIQEGYLDELGECVANAKSALRLVEYELEKLKDKYGIETS